MSSSVFPWDSLRTEKKNFDPENASGPKFTAEFQYLQLLNFLTAGRRAIK